MASLSKILSTSSSLCFPFKYRKTKHPDLHKWFCIETIKVCCPKGTFGPDCNGEERAIYTLPDSSFTLVLCVDQCTSELNKNLWCCSCVCANILVSLKPVSGAPTDLVTEMGCVTATELAEGTAGAAVTMVTGGSSALTAWTATSAK